MSKFNLNLTKRHSLKELSEGWTDDCHLIVKGASTQEVKDWQAAKLDEIDDSEAVDKLTSLLSPRIVSGKVLSTNADGSTELVTVDASDAEDVLMALPVYELRAIMETCVGFPQTPLAS